MTENSPSYRSAPDAVVADNAFHLLIVDDDQKLRQLIGRFLQENGFRVTRAEHAAAARLAMEGLQFDVIVLDVMMPGEDGFDFAKSVREKSDIPILMLTAMAEPDQRIQGLEIGVDDYLAKPFEPRELLLRLNNILKRSPDIATQSELRMGAFVFHVGRGELKRDDQSIKLTERERDLLRMFAQRPGTPIPRHELAGGENCGNERAVDVQINRLRQKIEADPSNPVYLQTVRGKGYILHAD